MRKHLAIIAVLVGPTLAQGADFCVHRISKYYDRALSQRLTEKGVLNSLHAEKGVCVAAAARATLDETSREVDSYFNDIALLPGDACEERALVEWAKREGLRFELAESRTSSGASGGNMFFIRSFSRAEVESNRKKLQAAPKDASCRK